jgi:hypothetical protein
MNTTCNTASLAKLNFVATLSFVAAGAYFLATCFMS